MQSISWYDIEQIYIEDFMAKNSQQDGHLPLQDRSGHPCLSAYRLDEPESKGNLNKMSSLSPLGTHIAKTVQWDIKRVLSRSGPRDIPLDMPSYVRVF